MIKGETTKYVNKEGWEYILREDGRYHATNSTNVFRKGDEWVITSWYPLIYTKEQAAKYLTPVK